METEVFQIQTPIGILTARSNVLGLASLEFSETNNENISNVPNELFSKLQIQLSEYFSGKRKEFSIPLSPEGTPFQQSVWKELQNIPYGSTITYKQQSDAMNSPLAIRAIAHANGQNPIAILIPCHRVVGKNGTLTGYSGGLWRKKFLLELELKNTPIQNQIGMELFSI